MRLHTRFLVPVVCITAVAAGAAFLAEDRMVQRRPRHNLDNAVSARIREIRAYQDQIERYCLSHAASFSESQDVQEAYALAHAGNVDDPADQKAREARVLLRGAFEPIMRGFSRHMGDRRLLMIEDTVEFFNLITGVKLTKTEKADLVAFLRCL